MDSKGYSDLQKYDSLLLYKVLFFKTFVFLKRLHMCTIFPI